MYGASDKLKILKKNNNMANLVPAVLVDSEKAFAERVSNDPLKKVAPLWQVDVLDGSMYKKSSWAEAEKAAQVGNLPEIELHLMIQNPLPVVKAWHEHVPSLKRAIIHAEIDRPLGAVIDEIEKLGLNVGIALNPETPIEDFRHEIERANILLIMGVHPGASGQAFLGEPILKKIERAKKRFPKKIISVDGGVTKENAVLIKEAGADQLCSASAIWGGNHPEEAFTALSSLL